MRKGQEEGARTCNGNDGDGGEDAAVCGVKERWFKSPERDCMIEDFSREKFADNSNKRIKRVVNLYSEWRKNRMQNYCTELEIVRCDLDKLNQFSKADMCYSLARFIRKVTHLNGKGSSAKHTQGNCTDVPDAFT